MKKGTFKQSVSENEKLISLWSDKNSINPSSISSRSKRIVKWTCKNNHEWETHPDKIYMGGDCPYCMGKKTTPENNLQIEYPDLCKEWDYNHNKISPTEVMPRTGKKYHWICKKGHKWIASPHNRTTGQGCPYCTNVKVNKDNSLANTKDFKYLCKEWDYKNNSKTPKEIVEGSTYRAHWICENGHKWQATVKQRTQHHSMCPFCSQIELKNGECFASLIEVQYYLMLKSKKIPFIRQKTYPNSRKRCDFYLPKTNTYVELTSYTKSNMFNNKKKHYIRYLRKIVTKKKITRQYGANFVFIQKALTPQEIKKINKHRKSISV